MPWPKLPRKAAYLSLLNERRRNALSLSVLRDLKSQLVKYNTSPASRKLRVLPPFLPSTLDDLEAISRGATDVSEEKADELSWLVDAQVWRRERQDLPNVLVLRSNGPVFSAGHDLSEIQSLSHDEITETFRLCAEVMTLIRRSPAPVVGVVQGLATAAGAQLALSTDIPVAGATTEFKLPGVSIGLPCTSPSTAVSRTIGTAGTYRMLALGEGMRADQLLGGAVDVVPSAAEGETETQTEAESLDTRVGEIVAKLARHSAGQPQALGKWAFWTQVGLRGDTCGGDGYQEAVEWTGRVMALHARSADAQEGIKAFLEKRRPEWTT